MIFGSTLSIIIVTIHHITGVGGIMIQNDGKQDVFQQLQGWIHSVLNYNPLDGGELNRY